MLSRARPYVITKQTGNEEEVEDFLSRLYVAYRLDFPLVRGLDETLEQYEARQDKEIQVSSFLQGRCFLTDMFIGYGVTHARI